MLGFSFHFSADVICMFRTTPGVSEKAGEDLRLKIARQLQPSGASSCFSRNPNNLRPVKSSTFSG
jgi:hypothetical protein